MYALVKFFDNVQYICNSKNITVKKGITKIKYSDGRMYPANIIAKNNDKKLLQKILQNIHKDIPYIRCKRLTNIKSVRITRINVVCKNDTIYTTATENSVSDCDIRNHIDRNRNNDEIDALKEDCDSEQITQTKNCIYQENANISSDCNKRIDCVDDNRNENKTDTQNGDCDYLGKADIPISCDIDTLYFINENESNTETHTQDKDCVYQRNSDVSTFFQNTHESLQNNNIEVIDNVNAYDVMANDTIENNILIADMDVSPSYLHNQFEPTTARNCVKKLSFSNVDNDNGNSNDESEYVPSENESTSSDSNISLHKKSAVGNSVSSQSSLDISKISVIGTACNDEAMYVDKSNVKSKQNCCVFCLKLQSQLARHLVTVHRDELEVKKFAVLPKKHEERKKIIDILRKQGNFMFNTKENVNTGKLIVSRRPNVTSIKTAMDFIACSKCKGFFAKSTIRYHSRRCLKKDFSKNKSIMIMGRRVTSRLHHLANDTLKIVYPVMRDDEVTRIIRYDELLIVYANKMCTKYKAQHQHDMIRARLRVLGRFLLALKKINKDVEDFQSIYHPKVYDHCISAINTVAGYNNEEQKYKAPATASTLSTLIKQIGNIFIAECIKKEDEEKKKTAKDFLKLLIVDIGISVNKTVMETQTADKRHKKVRLPSLEDIKCLYKYLKKTRTEAYIALQKSFSYSKWLSLAKVTLTSIHVFNRRRAGEIERTLIEDFETFEKVNKQMNSDIYNSLSIESRKIAEKYVRFCIRGKLWRTVPVLLSNELFQCVTLILKWRKEANVPSKNPYIFGLPGFTNHRYRYLRACVLMRKFAKECNASSSTTLRGTILRKHVAMYCIQLNLNDEVSDLATFMGHADKIHKQHYRMPQATRDILKISQYLEAIQGDAQDSNNESSSDSEVENLNDSFSNNIDCSDTTKDVSPSVIEEAFTSCKNQDNNKKRKRFTSPYGKTKRVRWTEKEKEAVLEAFAKYMENLTLPSLKEIQEMKRKYTALTHRTLPQIKTWIHNKQKTLKLTCN